MVQWLSVRTSDLKVPGSNPTEWHFYFKQEIQKMYCILSTMRWRKLLVKIRPYLQDTFPLLFYSSVFERLIFVKKSADSYSIFERPIFWPNPLNSTSVLGHLLRTRKNYPKIEVLLRGLGPKIGPLKMMSQYPLFVKKVGICTPFLSCL